MKKEILTEINRNREIMGLGAINLLSESVVGGVDDLIKLVTKKLSLKAADPTTVTLKKTFGTLTKKSLSDAEKLENIIGFVRTNSSIFDDVFMKKFRETFIQKLPQNVKDELEVLKKAIEDGTVPENKIRDLLTDPSGGVMRNADDETISMMEDYFKTFIKKSTPNTAEMAANLQRISQEKLDKFINEIETSYSVILSQGGKRAEIVNRTLSKLRGLNQISDEAARQIMNDLGSEINKVKDSWLKKYLMDMWSSSRLVRFSVRTLAGVLTFLLVCEIIELFTGLDIGGATIALLGTAMNFLRSWMSDSDYQELNKKVNSRFPKKERIPITQDDEPKNDSDDGVDWSQYRTGNN